MRNRPRPLRQFRPSYVPSYFIASKYNVARAAPKAVLQSQLELTQFCAGYRIGDNSRSSLRGDVNVEEETCRRLTDQSIEQKSTHKRAARSFCPHRGRLLVNQTLDNRSSNRAAHLCLASRMLQKLACRSGAAWVGDEETFGRDTLTVDTSHHPCPDCWLSGWIWTSFLGSVCLVHERKHDCYRPEDWPRYFHAALPSAIAILSFVTGSFLGNLFSQSRLRYSHRLIFGAIAGLLATVVGLERYGTWNSAAEIALLSLAMGMLNPALSNVGVESVSLTFVTGTLNRMGKH